MPCCFCAVLCCAVVSLRVAAGEENKELWKAHDATELVKTYSGPPLPTLIDTGSADNFLEREVRAGQLGSSCWLVG